MYTGEQIIPSICFFLPILRFATFPIYSPLNNLYSNNSSCTGKWAESFKQLCIFFTWFPQLVTFDHIHALSHLFLQPYAPTLNNYQSYQRY